MPVNNRSDVTAIRGELSVQLIIYLMIHDCIEGEPVIKGMVKTSPFGLSLGTRFTQIVGSSDPSKAIDLTRAKRYLPVPNPSDTSLENTERYRAYVQRAVYYNFTARTLEGLVGEVFKRDPVCELPDKLQFMFDNADGAGVGLFQIAKRAVRYALPYGRCGILADFPQTENGLTKADIERGKGPTICVYAPWDVINWRMKNIEGKDVLGMLVLREFEEDDEDEFALNSEESYRVYRLNDAGQCTVQMYEQSADSKQGKKKFAGGAEMPVLDGTGKPLDHIPFYFVGSENNDCCVDRPPFYDIASLNLAHYRNSADYEESCFLVGQPTPVLAGLTEEWVENVLKGSVALGSRAAIPLPAGASAELLQADPNQLIAQAMDKKERQAVALGAKIVQEKQVQRTATDALMEGTAENSILASVAINTSDALTRALKDCANWLNAKIDSVKLMLNSEFELMNLSADDVSKIVASWKGGALAWEEMRASLRKAGYATMKDDDAKAAIADERAELIASGVIANPFGTVDNTGGAGPTPPKPDPNAAPAKHSKTATGIN